MKKKIKENLATLSNKRITYVKSSELYRAKCIHTLIQITTKILIIFIDRLKNPTFPLKNILFWQPCNF